VAAPGDVDVALFDLDRTLIDCNSGRLWLAAERREGRIGVRDLVWASYWLVRYGLGYDEGLDEVFAVAVRTLEGEEEAVLEERVARWFEREVGHRLRAGAQAVVDEHRAAGHRLVLATSSTTYVARCAVAAYALHDEVSTDFVVEDGRFTGAIGQLAVGRAKAGAVQRWAEREGVDLQRCAFYTDSASDLALLEAVGRPVVVHPDRRLAREAAARGWPVVWW